MPAVKILGLGECTPSRRIPSEHIDSLINKPAGWTREYIGIEERLWVGLGQTVSAMAAVAVRAAVSDAGISLSDVDLICYTGASLEQPIPCTAAFIQRELGLADSGIACFDINSTCLSFLTALDTISHLVDAGRFKHPVIVSSEIASVGINPDQIESFVLFGDGAVAAVLGRTPEGESATIIRGLHKTYSDGLELCEIRGGGTRLPSFQYEPARAADYRFHMDGRGVFKMSLKAMPSFIEELFDGTGLNLGDMAQVIPHQASPSGMKLIRKRLGIEEDRFVSVIETRGNMISASIPCALLAAYRDGRIQRGDAVALIGTGAGLSIGGVILVW